MKTGISKKMVSIMVVMGMLILSAPSDLFATGPTPYGDPNVDLIPLGFNDPCSVPPDPVYGLVGGAQFDPPEPIDRPPGESEEEREQAQRAMEWDWYLGMPPLHEEPQLEYIVHNPVEESHPESEAGDAPRAESEYEIPPETPQLPGQQSDDLNNNNHFEDTLEKEDTDNSSVVDPWDDRLEQDNSKPEEETDQVPSSPPPADKDLTSTETPDFQSPPVTPLENNITHIRTKREKLTKAERRALKVLKKEYKRMGDDLNCYAKGINEITRKKAADYAGLYAGYITAWRKIKMSPKQYPSDNWKKAVEKLVEDARKLKQLEGDIYKNREYIMMKNGTHVWVYKRCLSIGEETELTISALRLDEKRLKIDLTAPIPRILESKKINLRNHGRKRRRKRRRTKR